MGFFKSVFNHNDIQLERSDDNPMKEFSKNICDMSENDHVKEAENSFEVCSTVNAHKLESDARGIKKGAFQEVDEYGRVVHATSVLNKFVDNQKVDRRNVFGSEFGGTNEIIDIIGNNKPGLEVYRSLCKKWNEAIEEGKILVADMNIIYNDEQRQAALIIGSFYSIDKLNCEDGTSENSNINREYFYINGEDKKAGVGEEIKGFLTAAGHIVGDVGSDILAQKIGMGDCAGLIDLECIGNVGYHMSAVLFSYLSEAFHNRYDLLGNKYDDSSNRIEHLVTVSDSIQHYGGHMQQNQESDFYTAIDVVNDVVQGIKNEEKKTIDKSVEKGLYDT